ncbi:MAG: hypothetical protein ACPG7F_05895, partial [Aggregatilineales bacterium]
MIAPQLIDIFEIFYSQSDAPVQTQELIRQVLLRLVQDNDTLQHALVYLHSQERLILYATTDETVPALLKLQNESDYAGVLSDRQVIERQESGQPVLLLPVVTMNEVAGVLRIAFAADTEIDTDTWVTFSRHFALAMENRQLNTVM